MTKRIELPEAAEILRGAEDILLLCHRNPDGDTLGTAFGLYHMLRALGKRARVLCSDPMPKLFLYLTEQFPMEEFSPALIVAVDIASETLFGPGLDPYKGKVDLCIDHHPSNTGYAARTCLRPDAAATAEIGAELVELLGVLLTPEIADCLYTGLATDTGCFRYSNTTARTLRTAAQLVEAGARLAEINRRVFETKSRGRIALERKLLATIEYFADGKGALLCVTREMLRESGATDSDLDALSGLSRQIEGVEIGLLFKQREDGKFKVSVRTNSLYEADAICARLGGGGHMRAAGCQLGSDYEQAKAQMLGAIDEYLASLDAVKKDVV